MSLIKIAPFCSLTYFNTNLVGVSNRRVEARPVHIYPHHNLIKGRESGHGCGVLKRISNLNQIAVRVRYCSNVGIIASMWSLPVVDAEVIDVARAVVAIHNVPGEGDVGEVFVGLNITDNFMGICKCVWHRCVALKLNAVCIQGL